MSEQQSRPFAVTCPDCETRETFTDANDAVAMYHRHRGLTGHDIVWERTELPFEIPAGPVVSVLADLEAHYDEGVPIGVLTAAMAEYDVSIAETLTEVHDLRMSGKLYEPRDDRLAVV